MESWGTKIERMDLQSTPNGEYKWLMNYQDHLTKFIQLRPLKSKRVEEEKTHQSF
jgi:hypothetical protein